MNLGEIKQNYDLVLRCPHCGDSKKHQDKGHYRVNLRTGQFHCMRCGYSGIMKVGELLDLLMQVGDTYHSHSAYRNLEVVVPGELKPGPGLMRKSLLERSHIRFRNKLWDAFKMRFPGGTTSGVYLRTTNKTSFIYGEKSLGYCGEGSLISDASFPLRIVEGPYDVVKENDVSVFGIISNLVIEKYLLGHSLILCPDGDTWHKRFLAMNILKVLDYSQPKGAEILGIDILPRDKDPDEVDDDEIIQVRGEEVWQFREDLRQSLFSIEISSEGIKKFSALPVNIKERERLF